METMHTRRQAWARHVQAWRGSGLTQVAYCQQHEPTPRAVASWIGRSKQPPTPQTLVPRAVQGPSAAGELLLQHASGWRLALPAGIDATWLAGLLRGIA